MASNPQVHRLLKEMLELGKTPEEVCRDCPELLPEVRQRWCQFQLIDAQLKTLLPGLGPVSDAGPTALDFGTPVANAVLTTENDEQAVARMTEKGRDAARVAVEMANLSVALEQLGGDDEDEDDEDRA